MSRQCNCRNVCKISLWLVEHIINYSTPNFDRISNSIAIPLMEWRPGPAALLPFYERGEGQVANSSQTMEWVANQNAARWNNQILATVLPICYALAEILTLYESNKTCILSLHVLEHTGQFDPPMSLQFCLICGTSRHPDSWGNHWSGMLVAHAASARKAWKWGSKWRCMGTLHKID